MRYILATLMACCLLTAGTANGKTDYVTAGLVCIHHYEGAWNANTGNGYYGGLQQDLSFQRTYGYMYVRGARTDFLRQWGTADNWPIWAQLIAGKHGYRARGWSPWPNTARMCGLM